MPREIRLIELNPYAWVVALVDDKRPAGIVIPVHLRNIHEAAGFAASIESCVTCERLTVGACTCSPEAFDCAACEQIEATGRATVPHVTGRSCALALPADCADPVCKCGRPLPAGFVSCPVCAGDAVRKLVRP